MAEDQRKADKPIIRITDLHFGYRGQTPVFNRLSLTFGPNEKVGITGPNGSGKSTLFLVIMGFLKPKRGTAELFGVNRSTENDFAKVRSDLGIVFQNSDDQLFSTSLLEDVAFGPINQGRSLKEAESIARSEIDQFGLKGLESRTPQTLSEGEKRRAALAGVMAMSPKALLLDEPFTGLDESSSTMLAEFLKTQAPPFILIDHNRGHLESFCNRTLILSNGEFTEVT